MVGTGEHGDGRAMIVMVRKLNNGGSGADK